MERKMDFWTIEISAKFKEKTEAERLQKAIIDKFYYECNKNKDYMAQVAVGISNINSKYVIGVYNERPKNGGRPKKRKDILKETDFNKLTLGELKKDWHIHILALTNPSETLARIIKDYIDKNWNVGVSYKKFKYDGNNDIDIEMLFYIAKQSDTVLYYGNNDKRFKYTFKQMYEAWIVKYTNLKFDKKYNTIEKYRERKDNNYNEMINYFSSYCDKNYKAEREKEYMVKVKYRKIKERYEEIEKRDGYVLNNK